MYLRLALQILPDSTSVLVELLLLFFLLFFLHLLRFLLFLSAHNLAPLFDLVLALKFVSHLDELFT